MRTQAARHTQSLSNTIPGVSSHPNEKPDFSGIHAFVFGLTPHAAQYPKGIVRLSPSPVYRTYSAKITRFITATSRFIAHQAFLFYRILPIKSRLFRDFAKMPAENFIEFSAVFLYIIHKNQYFSKKQRNFSENML